MSRNVDYSRWDNIEVSSDDDRCDDRPFFPVEGEPAEVQIGDRVMLQSLQRSVSYNGHMGYVEDIVGKGLLCVRTDGGKRIKVKLENVALVQTREELEAQGAATNAPNGMHANHEGPAVQSGFLNSNRPFSGFEFPTFPEFPGQSGQTVNVRVTSNEEILEAIEAVKSAFKWPNWHRDFGNFFVVGTACLAVHTLMKRGWPICADKDRMREMIVHLSKKLDLDLMCMKHQTDFTYGSASQDGLSSDEISSSGLAALSRLEDETTELRLEIWLLDVLKFGNPLQVAMRTFRVPPPNRPDPWIRPEQMALGWVMAAGQTSVLNTPSPNTDSTQTGRPNNQRDGGNDHDLSGDSAGGAQRQDAAGPGGSSGSQPSQPTNSSSQTSNQTPQTSNQPPQTSNPSPQTSNPSPQASNQRPQASNQRPQASNQRPQASNQRPQASNQRPQASNQFPQASNQSPWTSNTQNSIPPQPFVFTGASSNEGQNQAQFQMRTGSNTGFTPVNFGHGPGDLNASELNTVYSVLASLATNSLLPSNPTEAIRQLGHALSNQIFTAAKHGDVSVLQNIFNLPPKVLAAARIHAAIHMPTTLIQPLHLASFHGHMGVCRFLLGMLNTASVNVPAADHETPLHKAAYNAHDSVVRVLLAAGADPNSTTPLNNGITRCVHGYPMNENGTGEVKKGRYTPLFYAVFNKPASASRTACVRELLEAQADPNRTDALGISPLYLACNHGYKDIVKVLHHHSKTNINLQIGEDAKGESPLIRACLMGFADIVKELLVQPCFSLVRAKVEQGERPSDGIDDMDGPGADVMIRTRYLAVLPELELSG